jgi:GNAT superfamily N-acetyltransferase
MRIRPASPADANGIAAVHVDSWDAHYRGILADDFIAARGIDVRRRQWASLLAEPARLTLVAEDGDTIAGFASAILVHGRFDVYLHTLYLARGATGHGLGKRLVAAVARELLERGARTMSLRVLRLNRARSFYESLGARLVPEGIPEDAGLFDDVVYAFDDLDALVKRIAT